MNIKYEGKGQGRFQSRDSGRQLEQQRQEFAVRQSQPQRALQSQQQFGLPPPPAQFTIFARSETVTTVLPVH
jgi:hypothetical protein